MEIIAIDTTTLRFVVHIAPMLLASALSLVRCRPLVCGCFVAFGLL